MQQHLPPPRGTHKEHPGGTAPPWAAWSPAKGHLSTPAVLETQQTAKTCAGKGAIPCGSQPGWCGALEKCCGVATLGMTML